MSKLHESRPFIVCEIGSNFVTLEHCLDSITLAHRAGADAVKFQAYDWPSLYGIDQISVTGTIPYGMMIPRWKTMVGQLPMEWLPELAKEACRIGVELMITAFSPELVLAVDPYVSVHKIASSDLNYPQLLEAVAKCGKPVLLSTGAATEGDIGRALDILDGYDCDTTLLYCVASYPARTVDLRVMELLEERFDIEVGFSDHTTDVVGTPIVACAWGATVLEKHVTFFPELDTPDRPHSLTGEEFKLMVDQIRGEVAPEIGPTSEETAMVSRHRRRLIATRDIAVGERLVYGENYGAYRALQDDDHGMSPFLWNQAKLGPEGKGARVAITKGKGIGPGDF